MNRQASAVVDAISSPEHAVPPRTTPTRLAAFARSFLTVMAVLGLCLGGLATHGSVRYGSFAAAVHAWSGDVLLVEASRQSFGMLDEGDAAQVAFNFMNISNSPVRILGWEGDCGCMLLRDDLPLSLNPRSRRSLTVTIEPPRPGLYEGRVRLFTSAPGARLLELRVVGEVRPRALGDSMARREQHVAGY